MKIIILLTCFLTITLTLSSQEDLKLYLLMSYTDDFERDSIGDKYTPPDHKEYPKIIFNIDSDTLVAFDTINIFPNHALNKIMQYPENDFFYLEEVNMYRYTSPNFFSFLDYSGDSIIIRRYNSEKDNRFLQYYSTYTGVFNIDGKLWIKNQFELKPVVKDQAMNRKFDFMDIYVNDYQNFYRTGSSPFQYQPSILLDYTLLRLQEDRFKNVKEYQEILRNRKSEIGSKLKIPYGIKKYDNMPDFKVQIPKEYRDSTISQVRLDINNERYFVGSGMSKNKSPVSGIERHYRWVYNKETESMDTLLFDGRELYFLLNYKDWLYGSAILKGEIISKQYDFESKEGRMQIQAMNEEMVKGKYNLKNGRAPYLLNKLGQHILIHLPTKKRIKWQTESIDSEILLIEDDKIYFRDYDEIKCVDIDVENIDIDWESETVLVKDKDIVQFVHHIFFSSSRQNKLKEMWFN